jgi:cobalt-zinc-cadmium efflux system membrane fusion protein
VVIIRLALHGLLTLATFAGLGGAFYAVGHDGRLPWQPAPTHGEDWCGSHGVPLSEDELCNKELARGGLMLVQDREPGPDECPNALVRITMPDEMVEAAGLRTTEVKALAIDESIDATAETDYLPGAHAHVVPRVPGTVVQVLASVGQSVEAGDVLAILDSQVIGESIAELRRARAILKLRERTHAQEKELARKKIGTGRDLLEAEASLEESQIELATARQRLLVQGVTAEEIDRLTDSEDMATRLEVRAPIAGEVLDVTAVVGDAAAPGRPLFAVADLSRLRLAIAIYEQDLPKVEEGQRVVFHLDGLPGERFVGHVQTVGGEVDERTRTIPVLADVKNKRAILRAGMFGHAAIRVRPAEPRIVVPKSAVQTDGDCWFVFTNPVGNVFKSRSVDLGVAYAGSYEIRGGLVEGEKIVTTGSFLLKSEVLRGEMGAG